MPQLSCVHCNQSFDSDSRRQGNMVTCPSCNGQMYVPQVLEKKAAPKQVSASASAPITQRKAPPIRPRSQKPSSVSASGVGITLLILGIVVIGGAGLTTAGYFVYKAMRAPIEAKEARRKADEATALEEKKRQEEATIAISTPQRDLTKKEIEGMRNAVIALEETGNDLEEDYKEDLEQAGLLRLLTPDRIAKDTDFTESRRMLKDIREAFEFHRAEALVPFQEFIVHLDAIQFESRPKEEFMASVRKATAAVEESYKELWELEAQVLSQYEHAIIHLEGTRGKWKLEGDTLAFDDVKDADRYKQIFTEIDKYTQRQADLVRQRREQNARNSTPIKKLLGL